MRKIISERKGNSGPKTEKAKKKYQEETNTKAVNYMITDKL